MFGVTIVAFNSSDVIIDCLSSLMNSDTPNLHVVVVDNASTDSTNSDIAKWAMEAKVAFAQGEAETLPWSFDGIAKSVTLLTSEVNLGYAGGVNIGLEYLKAVPLIDLFWVLNPDCRIASDAPAAFIAAARNHPGFGLLGGRVVYVSPENTIQSDGGQVNQWTGMCRNLNLGSPISVQRPADSELDYVSGANIVASRAYLEQVGVMEDDYFLYYEEVDWAFRRGSLPIVYADGAVTYHHAGTAIGSPLIGKEQGSAFSNYFNYRNRMRFMRRFFPNRLAVAYLYSLAKVGKLLLQRHFAEAEGAFRGLHGLNPPKAVTQRLTPEALQLATKAKA